jgi:hypothetical protein
MTNPPRACFTSTTTFFGLMACPRNAPKAFRLDSHRQRAHRFATRFLTRVARDLRALPEPPLVIVQNLVNHNRHVIIIFRLITDPIREHLASSVIASASTSRRR